MRKSLPLLATLLTLFSLQAQAQQWGYVTLIAKQNTNSVSLIDTNNAVVKQWTGLMGNTGYSSYMAEGGVLWRTVKAANTSFNGGGICGRVQKVNWNGTILFDYEINDTEECSHHDICPLPNGNVLLIVYERKTAAEVQQAGCSVNAVRWSEKIVELQPTGTNTATVVWEWKLWDHLVQNLYTNKDNYQSSIVLHPELMNVNYDNTRTDWIHMNGIDYNATLDQIVVSSHWMNELWVIDHSTTTAEAATHAGGNSGKGGDFLYRWGNPAAYQASGTTIFNVVHDAHWVPEGSPRAGWLGGFNNKGGGASISSVDLFQPPWNGSSYTHTSGQAYGPPTFGYRHTSSGYSSNMGNSQQLPNGNMLVCLATASKVYEINPAGTQIWQYTSTGAIPQAWRYTRCYMESPQVEVENPDPMMCAGGSVQLDITPSANATSSFTYNWSPGTGLSSTTVQDPVVSGITSGITYTVTVTTAGGCSATASVAVSITSGGINADAGGDVTINSGQSTTLTASGGSAYHWSTNQNTSSITVSPSTTTTYSVTVTGSNGCTDTDEVTVFVSDPTAAQATATPSAICIGESTQLSANASGGSGNYTYQWASTPAGFTSNQSDPVALPTANTTYRVTVSDGSTTATSTVLVTVYPKPAANAGSNQTIVSGQTADLTAIGGGTYEWSTNETTASIQVAPTATSTYTVTVTNANGCTDDDEVLVTVTPAVSVTATGTPTAFCLGGNTQLNSTPANGTGTYTYEWSSSPAGFTSTSSAPVATPTQTTTYTVVVSDGVGSATASVSITVHPLPNADAGSDVSILIGTSATLAASGGGTYAWNTGGTGASISVSPTLTTTYTVTVTSAEGCAASDAVTVTVTGSLLSTVVSASDSTLCLGDSTHLSAVPSGGTGNYTYTWTANGAFFSSAQHPVANPAVSTLYEATVGDGVSTVLGSLFVQVGPRPVANAGSDVSILIGTSATLAADGGGTYAWSNGANTSSTTVSPTASTTYTVTVTNAQGCTDADAVLVSVTVLPLEVTVAAADTIICQGDSTQLSASASGGSGSYTYTWSANGVAFSTLSNPIVSPLAGTLYTVVVADGIDTLEGFIPVFVSILPSVLAGSDVNIPTGSSVTLTAVSTGEAYLWSTSETTASITVSPTQTTTYTVTVTNASGCTASDEVQVTVVPLAPLTLSISATDTVICFGDAIQMFPKVSGGTGTYTYSWTSDPAGFASDFPEPFVNPEATTTYTLVVSDGSSQISLSFTVTVHPLPQQPSIERVGQTLVSSSASNNQWFYYGIAVEGATGQVLTPTETGAYQVQIVDANGCYSPLSEPYEFIVSSVRAALAGMDWSIVPNPASDVLLIFGDFDEAGLSVEIWESTGSLALRSLGSKTVGVSVLPAGAYLLRVQTARGAGLRKLVVLR